MSTDRLNVFRQYGLTHILIIFCIHVGNIVDERNTRVDNEVLTREMDNKIRMVFLIVIA